MANLSQLTKAISKDLSPNRLLAILLILNLLLALTSILLGAMDAPSAWQEKFDLNKEANIASWFSAILWLFIALVSYLNYSIDKHLLDQKNFRWLLIAFAFLYTSIDEAASIHETLISHSISQFFYEQIKTDSIQSTLIKSGNWLWVYVPLAIAFFLVVGRFLWQKLDKKYMRLSLLIGLGCFLLSFSFEYIQWVFSLDQSLSLFNLSAEYIKESTRVVEEVIENIGAILILYSFSRYAENQINSNS